MFARAVDGFVMSCIFVMLWILVGVVGLWLVFASDIDDGDGTALFVLLVIAALVVVVLYDVLLTARRGSAVGKNIIDVVVIRWSAFNDAATCQPFPSNGQSFVRWLVPHSVLFAGVVVVCSPRLRYRNPSFLLHRSSRLGPDLFDVAARQEQAWLA